jgi:hypothetical protein
LAYQRQSLYFFRIEASRQRVDEQLLKHADIELVENRSRKQVRGCSGTTQASGEQAAREQQFKHNGNANGHSDSSQKPTPTRTAIQARWERQREQQFKRDGNANAYRNLSMTGPPTGQEFEQEWCRHES